MQIAIVYNTYSAKGKGIAIAKIVAEMCESFKIITQLFENDWPANFDIFQFVFLIGGDGTINYFINQYPNLQIPLAILPGGTGNDLFWKIYGMKTTTKIIEKVCTLLQKNGLHTCIKIVDIGECELQSEPNEVVRTKYFINGIGLGFDGEVLKNMDTIRWIGGHLGYLYAVLKNIFSFQEPTYQITCNNETYTIRCTLLNIANSSRTGGGFLVSPNADVFDGQLNLFHCFSPSILARLHILSKVEKGQHIFNKDVYYQPVQQITIQPKMHVYGQLDGELIQVAHIMIGLANWKLNVAVV
jgi:diacylglycerol kinase family enzyme